MLPYSKFVTLYNELSECCKTVENHLNSILGETADVLADFGVDGYKDLTIYYYDENTDSRRTIAIDECAYSSMLKISSKEELLSFLNERTW